MAKRTNQPENPFEKWLTTAELINLLNITPQALNKNIKAGKYRVREVEGLGRGGKQYLVALSSIPLEAQLKYWEAEIGIENIEGNIEYENLARTFKDEKTKQELLWKEKVIQQANIIRKRKKHVRQLKELAASSGISLATLYRWLDHYDRGGSILTLVREGRADAGIPRSFDLEAAEYLKIEYIKTLSKTKAYQNTLLLAKEKGWKIGAKRTAFLILDRIPKEQLILTKEGNRGLLDKIATPILRDHSVLRPLEFVFGDHHELKIMCRDGRSYFRPWITAWLDARTRTIVGFCLNKQPNSMTVGLALRHAVLPKLNPEYIPYGIPEIIYIDNGKDYRGHFLSGNEWKERSFGKIDFNLDTKLVMKEAHIQETSPGLFQELGIGTKFATPYNAKAKMIERWFRNLVEDFAAFLPGYTGKNASDRPKEKLKKEMENGEILTLEELYPLLEQYIIEYHRRPHRSLKGASPENIWLEYMEHGWQPRTLANERLFDLLLLKAERRKVSNLGVQMFGEYYVNDQLVLGYYGQWVEVRYDPFDLSEVHIFKDGQFICTAEAYQYATLRDSREEIAERIAAQRHQAKVIMQRRKNLLNRQEQIIGENGPGNGKSNIIFFHPQQKEADKMDKAKEKKRQEQDIRRQAKDAWDILSKLQNN